MPRKVYRVVILLLFISVFYIILVFGGMLSPLRRSKTD